jgi:hypothetical protein
MNFSDAVKAQLHGRVVRRARLVLFDFASGQIGVWNGARPLRTAHPFLDGQNQRWIGAHGLGRLEGVAQSIDGSAPEMRLSISGVDDRFAAKVKAEAAEYYNRSVWIYSQFFTADNDLRGPWQLLDKPFAESWGLMHSMIAKREPTDNGWLRTVTITAETPFSGRKRPPFSYLTSTDQEYRYPGDRGADEVAGIENKLVKFPQ